MVSTGTTAIYVPLWKLLQRLRQSVPLNIDPLELFSAALPPAFLNMLVNRKKDIPAYNARGLMKLVHDPEWKFTMVDSEVEFVVRPRLDEHVLPTQIDQGSTLQITNEYPKADEIRRWLAKATDLEEELQQYRDQLRKYLTTTGKRGAVIHADWPELLSYLNLDPELGPGMKRAEIEKGIARISSILSPRAKTIIIERLATASLLPDTPVTVWLS